ncbi:NUDIX hydrolase [Lacticaseibacillus yichunensis]|uniref:NUDIX hydrolase n=1 Tax=Lacticaseibacillus yichunensis TaxID=2486015 RepID=A0ABW4CPJ6_9LACO|nr:NUDIX hydrolase [Lacticaseibacillus yichunensis]
MTDPVFGKRDPQLDYKLRVGVYGVIPDPSGKRLLVLGAPNHALFLPGGEVEAGESDEETLARELMEEFGIKVEIGARLGRATEYFYSHHRETAYYHPATFYACSNIQIIQPPLEDFNTLMLMPLTSAAAELKRPTYRYGVAQWLAGQNAQ